MKYLFLMLFPLFSTANYLSIGESGEMIRPSTYRVGGSFQTTSAGKGGVNVGGFLDSGWTEDMSSRFLFGVGAVEFQMGASLKYIPFPDVGQQPALGIRTAFWLTRAEDTSITTLQVAPIASKKITVDKGRMTSYFAIPVNLVYLKNSSTSGAQFTFGAEYEHPDVPDVFFSGEISLNLNKSDSGLGLFVCIPFDNTSGFKRRAE